MKQAKYETNKINMQKQNNIKINQKRSKYFEEAKRNNIKLNKSRARRKTFEQAQT